MTELEPQRLTKAMNDYCLAALQKIQHSPQVTIVLVSKKSLKILKTPILKLKYVSILLFVAKAVTYFASRLHGKEKQNGLKKKKIWSRPNQYTNCSFLPIYLATC